MIFKMNIFLIFFSFLVFIIIPFKSYSLNTKAEQAVVIEYDTNETVLSLKKYIINEFKLECKYFPRPLLIPEIK